MGGRYLRYPRDFGRRSVPFARRQERRHLEFVGSTSGDRCGRPYHCRRTRHDRNLCIVWWPLGFFSLVDDRGRRSRSARWRTIWEHRCGLDGDLEPGLVTSSRLCTYRHVLLCPRRSKQRRAQRFTMAHGGGLQARQQSSLFGASDGACRHHESVLTSDVGHRRQRETDVYWKLFGRAMKLTMRSTAFLVVLCIAAGSAIASGQPAPMTAVPQIANVGGDLYRVQVGDQATVFLVTPQGIILADPLSYDVAAWLRKELESRFPGRPVRYVLHTHHHFD